MIRLALDAAEDEVDRLVDVQGLGCFVGPLWQLGTRHETPKGRWAISNWPVPEHPGAAGW